MIIASSPSIQEFIEKMVGLLVKTFASLGPAGQKLLAIVLTAGLAVGYGSSALVCSNQKQHTKIK